MAQDTPFDDTSLTDFFEPDLPEIHVNKKTVFANPLAIRVSMSDYDRLSRSEDYAVRLLHDARDKLVRTVANETQCSGCPHMDVRVDQQENPIRGATEFQLRTTCKQAKKGMTSVVCPDGSITSVNTSGLDRSRVSFRPAPMVFKPAEDYKPPDQPTTNTGDTAW